MGRNSVTKAGCTMNIKKWSISFIIMLLLSQLVSTGLWTAAAAGEVNATELQEIIDEASAAIIKNGLQTGGFSDWAAIGLARAGKTIPGSYLAGAEQLVRQQV